MCFDQKTSAAFAAVGFITAIVAYRMERKAKTYGVTAGCVYFFLMEFLQFWQYFWIDQCDNTINKVLTALGFLHICFQPMFCHFMNYSLSISPRTKAQLTTVIGLCFVTGCLMFFRFIISPWAHVIPSDACPATEWLHSNGTLCTFMGQYHLAWAVPFYENTYFLPGMGIHCFIMFVPFFVVRPPYMWAQGLFLFLTGPFLANYITKNLQEQASIWCLMSTAQVAIMVFLLRVVVMNKKPTVDTKEKALKEKKAGKQKAK